MTLPDTGWHTTRQFEHNRLLTRCSFFSETSNRSARPTGFRLFGLPCAALRFSEMVRPQLSCTFRYKSRRAVARSRLSLFECDA